MPEGGEHYSPEKSRSNSLYTGTSRMEKGCTCDSRSVSASRVNKAGESADLNPTLTTRCQFRSGMDLSNELPRLGCSVCSLSCDVLYNLRPLPSEMCTYEWATRMWTSTSTLMKALPLTREGNRCQAIVQPGNVRNQVGYGCILERPRHLGRETTG